MPPTFIPRKTADAQTAGARHARVSVFFTLSASAFVLSLLAAGGVFFYQKILANRLVKMNNDLVAARAAFEPAFIEELQHMDRRIEGSKTLLAEHRVISPLFTLLEHETLATVRFTKFSFSDSMEPPSSGRVRLDLSGEAISFNAIALQLDVFSKNGNFLNPVFSNFDVDKNGTVRFSFTATVAPEFILYRTHLSDKKKSLEQNAAAGAAQPPAAPSSNTKIKQEQSNDIQLEDEILF